MSVNKRSRTDLVSEVIFLNKLVDWVVTGKVRVPRFQRGFVWKQPDLHALLDSILLGFPIGSILVWDTSEKITSTNQIGPVTIGRPPSGPVGYVLDGQQRVSTLVGTLRLTEEMESSKDQIDWQVYCDLDTLEFCRAPADGLRPQHFPVRSLLNTADFFDACRRIQSEVTDPAQSHHWIGEADRLANAFRDYQLPIVHIREADLDSAVTVFARLNRTGRKMSADEMVSALTYQERQFHLSQKFTEFIGELGPRGFGNIDRVFLLRAVLAALDRDIYAKDWADIMVKPEVREKLPRAFEDASVGIRRALDFLETLGVTSERLLPYGLQLVLLGEFFRRCPEPAESVVELLNRWFWVTSFTGWFGGVNTAQAKRALSEINQLAEGTGTGFSVIDLEAKAQPFPDRFDGRSARVRVFLLYLASLRPHSLQGTGALEPGDLLSTRGIGGVGYLFTHQPRFADLIPSPANRMFVDRDHTGQAFSTLLKLSDSRLKELLPTHGFPVDAIQRLRNDDRVGLIEARRETLIVGEREFMHKRKVAPPDERIAATIADSDVADDRNDEIDPGGG